MKTPMKTAKFPWSLLLVGLIVVILTLLPGCASVPTPDPVIKVVTRKPEIPASLKKCKAEPIATGTWNTSSRPIGKFLIGVADAGADCRPKLGAVVKIIDSF